MTDPTPETVTAVIAVEQLSDAGTLLEQAAAMLDVVAAYLMPHSAALGVSAARSIYGVQSLVEKAAHHVALAEDALQEGAPA